MIYERQTVSPCVTGPQKYQLGRVLFYNLNSDFAKCPFTYGVSVARREEFYIYSQLLLEIKVTQTLISDFGVFGWYMTNT